MTIIAVYPDRADIDEVLRPTLKPCPFCSSRPLMFMRINEESGVYQAHVKCSRHECSAGVFENAHDKEEARAGARARWESRT